MKNGLTMERMLELEYLLEQFQNMSVLELSQSGLQYDEILYVLKAMQMPIREMKIFIEVYESSFPSSIFRFVHDVSLEYHTDPKYAIQRIHEVRNIMRLEKQVHKATSRI